MNEMERIQKEIDRQKEIIEKLEAKWNEVPEESKDSQTIALELLKAEIADMERKLTL